MAELTHLTAVAHGEYTEPDEPIHDVSDDGNTILLTTTDGLVLWSNGTLTELAPRPAEGLIDLARLSGDGRIVVWQRQESSDPDGPVAVYRKEVGKDAIQNNQLP